MKRAPAPTLTIPDLVLLSLLAEGARHGYAANAELERRQVKDWAGVSRPQVYYSLEKMARHGLIRANPGGEPGTGPERISYAVTAKGKKALTDALERPHWAIARERPPFLTWMALCWQARPDAVRRQLQRRRQFLQSELAREETALAAVKVEVGHAFHEAVWMLGLTVAQFHAELTWLSRVEAELPRRAPALRRRAKTRHPPSE